MPASDRDFGDPPLWAVTSVVLLFTTVSPWMPKIGLFAGGADLDVYRDGARHVMAIFRCTPSL